MVATFNKKVIALSIGAATLLVGGYKVAQGLTNQTATTPQGQNTQIVAKQGNGENGNIQGKAQSGENQNRDNFRPNQTPPTDPDNRQEFQGGNDQQGNRMTPPNGNGQMPNQGRGDRLKQGIGNERPNMRPQEGNRQQNQPNQNGQTGENEQTQNGKGNKTRRTKQSKLTQENVTGAEE